MARSADYGRAAIPPAAVDAAVRAAAKGCVADQAGYPADEVLHVLLAPSEEVEKLRSTGT